MFVFCYSSLKKESEPGSKENVAVDVETGDTGSADQEKEKKLAGSLVRAGTMRKRSYSFSDGNFRIFRKYLFVP